MFCYYMMGGLRGSEKLHVASYLSFVMIIFPELDDLMQGML